MTQMPMLVRCGSNRIINLNHIVDIHFYEEKCEDFDDTFWTVVLKFSDGIREEINLTNAEFCNFYQGVRNALV